MNKITISNPSYPLTQKNHIELIGIVGAVRKTELAEVTVLRLSVATNRLYKAQDGTPVIETLWNTVNYYANKKETMYDIQKGDKIMIKGRLRNNRYTTADGEERTTVEVIADTLTLIDTTEFPMAQE